MADWEYIDDAPDVAPPSMKTTPAKGGWEYIDQEYTAKDVSGKEGFNPALPAPSQPTDSDPQFLAAAEAAKKARADVVAQPRQPGQRFNQETEQFFKERFLHHMNQGGWGISDDTANTLGANLFGQGNQNAGIFKPVADIPAALGDIAARALQGIQYSTETAGDLINRQTGELGINKALGHGGADFELGSIAPALFEAFPVGGAEVGMVPHGPARFTPEQEAHLAEILKPGNREVARKFAADNGLVFKDIDKYFDALESGKPVTKKPEYEAPADTPGTPEYPQVPLGEKGYSDNRPYTAEEQAIADKLQADKAAFKPSEEPTTDVFKPKATGNLEKDAAAFKAWKDGQKVAPEEEALAKEAEAFKNRDTPVEPDVSVPSEHVSAIDQKANEVKAGWTNAPDHTVYSSLDDIKDPAVRKAAEAGEAMDRPAFFGPDGRVYLNATQLSPEEVPAAVFHESLGHYGLAQKFRNELDQALRAMYDSNQGKYRLAADKWLKDNPDAYGGKATPERALEEVLSEESEKGVIRSSAYDRLANIVKRKAREMGLKMDFSDREIRSILADAHRQVTHGVKADTAPSGIRTMYIGQNARDLQNENGSRKDHVWDFIDDTELQKAEGRHDPVELRDRYGLHMGPDGGIRSEISDHNAKLKPEADWETVPSGERLTLGEVLDHPDLFRNYPRLKDVVVTRKPGSTPAELGWFDGKELNVTPSARDPLSVMLHEIQHWIQKEEGWSPGGNIETALRSMTQNQMMRLHSDIVGELKADIEFFKQQEDGSAKKYIEAVQKDIDKLNEAKNVKEWVEAVPTHLHDFVHDAYERVFGEIEARDTQARQDLTPDQRRAVLPYSNANHIEPRDVVMADRGGRSDSTVKPMRKKKPREEYVKAGVNLDRVDTMNDLTGLVTELEKTYRPNKKETWAETKAKAREYLLDANRLAKGLGVEDAAAKIHAYGMLHAQAMDDLAGVMKEMGEKGPTPEMQAKVAQYSSKLNAVRAGYLRDSSELGRATRAMAIMKTTAGKADEYLRLLDKHGGDAAVFSDPGVFLKFMSEYKALIDSGDIKGAARLLVKPKTFTDKFTDAVINAVNVPRSLMASFDLSAPLRQGFFLIGSRNFYRAWGPMLKQFVSEDAFKKGMADIHNSPAYPLMKKAGLDLSDIGKHLSSREEQFVSQWAEKIPLVGIGIKASERAYTGFLNKLRADTFNQLVVQSKRAGVDLESDSKALKDIASFVNAATGRGNLGSLNQSATALTTIFFSPRLIASRIQLLNPVYYAKLSPVVRKAAIKNLIASGTIAATVAGLAKLGGADVESDPRSSDFMKIKTGDTRYDIMGGFGQYITLGARLATNQTKSLKGDVKELGVDFPFDTRLDVAGKFATNKFSPAASFIADYLRGQNAVGQEFNMKDEVVQRVIPLMAQDAYSVMQEYGPAEGAARSVPTVFGVGVQNFGANDRAFDYKPPSTHFKVDGEEIHLVGSKYSEYRKITKEIFTEKMDELKNSPKWKDLDDDTKKAAVKELNKEVREEAQLRLAQAGLLK